MDLKELITDEFAIYQGDSCEKLKMFPENKIGFIIYSPPFDDLYVYSSSIHDIGNNTSYEEFLIHYEFIIKECERILMPGRIAAVHCMDIPRSGDQGLVDFPGDIINLHKKNGFIYWDRKNIWKEPLRVAIRSRDRKLMHQQIINDSTKTRGALADYVLYFKKKGENPEPVKHPTGLSKFIGDFDLLKEVEQKQLQYLREKYINYTDQKTNKLSQFIWRKYASSNWNDINAKRMLDYKDAKAEDDQRHVCPLHLDIIERSIILYTNEGDAVLTPFMGIGSEVYGAVNLKRKGIGIELKENYFNQAAKSLNIIKEKVKSDQLELI